MQKVSGDFSKIPKHFTFHKFIKLSNESLCMEWLCVTTNTVTNKFKGDLSEQRTFISVASTSNYILESMQ